MKKVTLALLACSAVALSADPKGDLIKHLNASKSLSLDIANAMPADGYSFRAEDKVQPPDRTFGEVMVHIGQSTYNYCGAISGTKTPAPPTASDKNAVVQYITEAFDACAKTADNSTDMDKMIKRGNADVSVHDIFWGMLSHDAHHRGQAEVYLRLKGVKPPAYKF